MFIYIWYTVIVLEALVHEEVSSETFKLFT